MFVQSSLFSGWLTISVFLLIVYVYTEGAAHVAILLLHLRESLLSYKQLYQLTKASLYKWKS